jgi:hypothetical protein
VRVCGGGYSGAGYAHEGARTVADAAAVQVGKRGRNTMAKLQSSGAVKDSIRLPLAAQQMLRCRSARQWRALHQFKHHTHNATTTTTTTTVAGTG